MKNELNVKTIIESLKEEVENGKISLREAAAELHKAGWTNFIDIDATKNLLKLRNATESGNGPELSDMTGKYREMKAAHPDALYISETGNLVNCMRTMPSPLPAFWALPPPNASTDKGKASRNCGFLFVTWTCISPN